MLDVVHYYFETDALGEQEEQDAKTRMRRTLYGQLYSRPYTWGQTSSSEFGTQDASGGQQLEHKPYIPPTPVNANAAKPFGTVLDAPLG
jgi:hypothetical protein